MTTLTAVHQATAIEDALAVLEVPSPTSHAWMGEVAELPGSWLRLLDRAGARRTLVASIQSRLYDSFYTQGTPRPATSGRTGANVGDLSAALAAANAGAGRLEPGWRVVGEDGPSLIVQRDGLRLWVAPEEVEAGARVGDAVSLRLPADLPAYSPGFFLAQGDRGLPPGDPPGLDRFYLDLHPEGAVPFVREATRRLNRAGLAFVAKVVDDPDGFDRRDAAVVVVARRDRDRAMTAVEDLHSALAPYVDDGAPAMTLRLAPGLAFAEAPAGGDSFGAHRCLLLAEAAVTAAERGIIAPEERIEVARERFVQAGTTIDAPYLGGST
jgi:hypothetical protein